MPNSLIRQRKRQKPLKELRRAIRADIDLVCQQMAVTLSARLRRDLEDEIFRLSDPFCPGYMEAPLPSHRGDLRRRYIRLCLTSRPGDPPPEEVAAPWLVPIPTQGCPPGRRVLGYPAGPRYDDACRAFRYRRRRKGLPT